MPSGQPRLKLWIGGWGRYLVHGVQFVCIGAQVQGPYLEGTSKWRLAPAKFVFRLSQ